MTNMEKLEQFARARQAPIAITFDPVDALWWVKVPWVAESALGGRTLEEAVSRTVEQAEIVNARESEVPDA